MFSFSQKMALGLLFAGIAAFSTNVLAQTNSSYRVVLFSKNSCPYCRYIKPKFSALTNKFRNSGIRFEVRTPSQSDTRTYGFRTVPTVVYFKDGKAVYKHGSGNGKVTTAQMEQHLKRIYGV